MCVPQGRQLASPFSGCSRNPRLSLKSTLFFTVETCQRQLRSFSSGCQRSPGWLCSGVSGQLCGRCRESGPVAGTPARCTHMKGAGLWPCGPAGRAEGHQGSSFIHTYCVWNKYGILPYSPSLLRAAAAAVCHLGFFQTFPRRWCKWELLLQVCLNPVSFIGTVSGKGLLKCCSVRS